MSEEIKVKIPDIMYAEICKIISEHKKYGYESVEEFIRESLRMNFMRLK